MRNTWDKLVEKTESFKKELEAMLELLPESRKLHRQTMRINKAWRQMQVEFTSMDKFISPVKSVKVDSPLLRDDDFMKTWQYWKDYLNEQHGIVMRSRAELMGLKRLAEISEDNPGTAVKTLEFVMSRPTDKNFYKVNETDLIKPTEEKTEQKVVVKIPKEYQDILSKKSRKI